VKRIFLNKYKLLILLFAGLFIVGSYFESFQKIENWGYGLISHENGQGDSKRPVTVIAIDNPSLKSNGPWPWPHNKLVELIKQIQQHQPKTISLLIDLSAAQTPTAFDRLSEESKKLKGKKIQRTLANYLNKIDDDQSLVKLLKNNKNIYISGFYRYSSKQTQLDDAFPYHSTKTIKSTKPFYYKWFNQINSHPVMLNIRLSPPHKKFSAVAKVGLVELKNSDQTINSLPLVLKVNNHYLASLALRVAGSSRSKTKQSIEITSQSSIKLGKRTVNTSHDFRFYPLITSQWSDNNPVVRLSANNVHNGANKIKNKHIFVGLTAGASAEFVKLANGSVVPLPLWYAHLTQGIIKNQSIRVPYWFYAIQRLLIASFALLLLLCPIRLYGKGGFIFSIVLAIVTLNAGLVIYVVQQVWIPLILPVFFLLLTHTILFLSYRKSMELIKAKRETYTVRKELGGYYQTQGNLNQAFEHYQQCEHTDDMSKTFYNLGLEFERRRQFDRALDVYQHLHTERGKFFKDSETRIIRLKEVTSKFPSSGVTSNAATQIMVIEDSGVEKPMLGRYQLERELGRGAMGMVYLGIDPKISRKVAIKTLALSDEFEGKALEETEKRFFREAEAIGRLNHPNIVTIYDVGEDQGVAYIAMDFIEGDTLSKYMFKENLLKTRVVMEIGLKVADALSYAHQQKVVHRDIKPANIMFNPKTFDVKVADFGIASLTDDSRTKTGTVLGSPSYMSPEQIAGRKISGKSDQFSLGITLYQLLTGVLPFDGDSMANLMYQITNQAHKPIRKSRRGISPCVSRIINKALQKSPENRFSDCTAMADAIEKCLDQT